MFILPFFLMLFIIKRASISRLHCYIITAIVASAFPAIAIQSERAQTREGRTITKVRLEVYHGSTINLKKLLSSSKTCDMKLTDADFVGGPLESELGDTKKLLNIFDG